MNFPKFRTLAVAALVAAAVVPSADAVAARTTSDAGRKASVPHVLVYSQVLGFRHLSMDKAKATLKSLSFDGRFTVQFSEDPKILTAATLAKTDAVLWLNNTAANDGASPFTDAQEKTYASWMSCGGAHVGVHAAVDAYSDEAFPAYVEANGAIFTAHPLNGTSSVDDRTIAVTEEGWGEPEHTILVKDQTLPMTAPWRGRSSFNLKEELYQLDRDPSKTVRDYKLLLAHGGVVDPITLVVSNVYPGQYEPNAPLAWSGSYRGKNRTFYTNLGHSQRAWSNGDFQRHLVNGIAWATQKQVDRGCLSAAGFSSARR